MASDCIVPVVEISNVREHPNADMLSIAEVLGYQVVSGLVEDPEGPLVRTFVKDQRDDRGRRVPLNDMTSNRDVEEVRYSFSYRDGDLAVYFPADTVLTDELAATFEVEHLLKTGNRVGRARLRGEPSFGLVVGLPEEGKDWPLGHNCADHFHAKKWEPPADKVSAPDAAPYDSEIDPHFIEYTDIQNGLLLYGAFEEGEEVVATEKIHGKNCRVGFVNGMTSVGSRTYRKDIKHSTGSIFWDVWRSDEAQALLTALRADGAHTVILFGEIYGQGVQSLHYGRKKEKGFRAFDIYVDGDYLDYEEFRKLCDLYRVERVPVVGKFRFDLDKVKFLSTGRSAIPGADNIREGVVVRPAKERRDPALGRVVLKFISTEYDLSKHKKKDTTDL